MGKMLLLENLGCRLFEPDAFFLSVQNFRVNVAIFLHLLILYDWKSSQIFQYQRNSINDDVHTL